MTNKKGTTKEIVATIYKHRKTGTKKFMTEVELAEKCGISQSTINFIIQSFRDLGLEMSHPNKDARPPHKLVVEFVESLKKGV